MGVVVVFFFFVSLSRDFGYLARRQLGTTRNKTAEYPGELKLSLICFQRTRQRAGDTVEGDRCPTNRWPKNTKMKATTVGLLGGEAKDPPGGGICWGHRGFWKKKKNPSKRKDRKTLVGPVSGTKTLLLFPGADFVVDLMPANGWILRDRVCLVEDLVRFPGWAGGILHGGAEGIGRHKFRGMSDFFSGWGEAGGQVLGIFVVPPLLLCCVRFVFFRLCVLWLWIEAELKKLFGSGGGRGPTTGRGGPHPPHPGGRRTWGETKGGGVLFFCFLWGGGGGGGGGPRSFCGGGPFLKEEFFWGEFLDPPGALNWKNSRIIKLDGFFSFICRVIIRVIRCFFDFSGVFLGDGPPGLVGWMGRAADTRRV